MVTSKFKKVMRIYGITYADLGVVLDRSPETVRQRLNTESTFHKHKTVYNEALNKCIENKDKEREDALKGLMK